ncbi:MAG TPA: ATP-binding cassette domain-containing protein [Bryobacteraceae bacterium]|nr:ATP-binding cassette domain-containing protein [Bryobacteraceae bacterium]
MPDKDNTIVEFEKVNMQFGNIWALRDINFALKPGETRVIFGQAGAGKTALLKSAIGLLHPDSGEVDLFGQNVTASRERDLYTLRSKAGVLFQEGALFDSLTIRENVAYPLENQRATTPPAPDEIEHRVRETLRFVELEHTLDKFPNELSGGMRRRVGIARAIVTEPPFVLYDSPTAGLDPITANTIMALIAKERDVRHTASLIVTHRYQDGELMANFRYNPEKQELIPVSEEEHHDPTRSRTKFFVMKDGEIVFQGTRAQLEENDDSYVKRFVRH